MVNYWSFWSSYNNKDHHACLENHAKSYIGIKEKTDKATNKSSSVFRIGQSKQPKIALGSVRVKAWPLCHTQTDLQWPLIMFTLVPDREHSISQVIKVKAVRAGDELKPLRNWRTSTAFMSEREPDVSDHCVDVFNDLQIVILDSEMFWIF